MFFNLAKSGHIGMEVCSRVISLHKVKEGRKNHMIKEMFV